MDVLLPILVGWGWVYILWQVSPSLVHLLYIAMSMTGSEHQQFPERKNGLGADGRMPSSAFHAICPTVNGQGQK